MLKKILKTILAFDVILQSLIHAIFIELYFPYFLA